MILLILCGSLFSETDRRAEGTFNVNQAEDGRVLVEFKGKNFDVRSYFLEQPKFYAQTAYHIMANPLIQFFLIVSPHLDVTVDHIMRMTLAEIGAEYRGLNLDVVKIDHSKRKVENKGDLSHITQQFVIDLENGFREFVTINLYRNSSYDVSTITRFTLSPSEKEDLDHRIKGNKITSRFHDDTSVGSE